MNMIDWKKPVPDTHNGENSHWKPQRSLSKPVPGSGKCLLPWNREGFTTWGNLICLKNFLFDSPKRFHLSHPGTTGAEISSRCLLWTPQIILHLISLFFWVEPNLQVYRNLLQLTILQKHLVFILNVDFSPLTSAIRFHQQESAWYPSQRPSVNFSL